MTQRQRLNIFANGGGARRHQPMKPMIQSDLADFMETIETMKTVEVAWSATIDFMRSLGASHVGISLNLEQSEPLLMWTTPPWMKDLFLQEIYPNLDPATEHCKTHVTPYLGGIVVEEGRSNLDPARRRYIEEITAADIRTTMSIPVHCSSGESFGIFDFAGNFTSREFPGFQKEFGAKIYLTAMVACRRIQALMDNTEGVNIELTPSERECLAWLGRGFRNERIADQLGIRPVTVEFHLANARRKLNARTREQALATAVATGLVDP